MQEKTQAPVPAAFIGLGAMGYPMAGHLARAGHQVTVFNRSAEKSARWVGQFGGSAAASAREAARSARYVFACVGNDRDLHEVTLGPHGAFHEMGAGAIFVDHTTASAQAARALYQAARERGLHFLDAPVSGGQAGAQEGLLTIMCGGDAPAFSLAQPLMRSYARAVTRIGESGSGQLAKMVNQICVAGVIQGLAEAIHFGERAGLDMRLVLDAIRQGAAQSWQMEHRGETMIAGKFDFGFAVQWMRKDLGICLEEARRNGASLPIAALIDQFYAELAAQGGARWDTSSLIQRLRGDRPGP